MLQISLHLQISAIITHAHTCARYLLFLAPLHMTARADLLAVIRAYMANDDPAGLAEDLLLTLELDQDQEDALNDLRNDLKAPL